MELNNKKSILKHIEEFGPLSSREIAEQMGVSQKYARAAVSYCKNYLKAIHIHSYRRDEDGGRLYPRALYAMGHKPDAKKPPRLSRVQYRQRHREKKRNMVSNIFEMAKPVDLRRVTSKKRPDMRKEAKAA